jgi:aspartate/methionine/tyrosine aminotransferase
VKWYLSARVNGSALKTSDALCDYFLNDHNVAMVPGSGFGAPEWIRLSYACSMDDLQKAVRRLHNGFAELAKARGGKRR